jgi:hypothetical protein
MQHWAGQNCAVDINECEDKNGNDCHSPFRRFILLFHILLPQLILLVNIPLSVTTFESGHSLQV